MLVLYDAECGLCKWLLAALLRWDQAGRLRPLALQRPEARELLHELSADQGMASWHLISAGRRHSAGAALPPLLQALPGGRLPSAVLARFPRATETAYRWVAGHRSGLSQLVPATAKRRASELVRRREEADVPARRSSTPRGLREGAPPPASRRPGC